ncbi:MAG: tRNA(Ile)-lysidine synthase [Pyrinomonadaceae bacterium]|jgi:tRNA(Ile)-lysidine synthase|nr:tRNA(Ile)-lysidine synthase [Pyrinomonadaceae bacterium]
MKKLNTSHPPTDAGTKRPLSRFARRLSQAWRQLALPGSNESDGRVVVNESDGRVVDGRDERVVNGSDGRVIVAVSGGADSTALLLALDELKRAGRLRLTLKVAHLDHELRGEASTLDARFVEELAGALGYEAIIGRAPVKRRARATRDNLEQAARRERYEFLGRAAREWEARAVAVAHTLEDQAETLLLALLRGSGARGLGAMRACRPFDESGDELLLVRPLLDWARRAETQEYCAARGVAVRPDAMNVDERFARVRVRRQLLPLLETFNPRAVETLARTAALLRAQDDALEHLGEELLTEACRDARLQSARRAQDVARKRRRAVEKDAVADERAAFENEGGAIANEKAARADVGDAGEASSPLCDSAPLSVEVLRGADAAVLSYALRGWLKSARGNLRRIEATHIEAVAGLLEGARGGRVAELPGGARVERRRGLLLFRAGVREAGKS